MSKKTTITKASGEKDTFDAEKLRHSLERSGANSKVIDHIIKEVNELLYEGIPTHEIYKKAFSLLHQQSHSNAARYKLKKAIYELGPAGFAFEKFVAKILNFEGFSTKANQIIQGHCINHEIDIIASKEKQRLMIECKFHNDQGRVCDVKVPLYISARYEDIKKKLHQKNKPENKFDQGCIFTNTRFTGDATQFGNCYGLMLISWDYPKNNSLKLRIDASGLHPITCLTTISEAEKQKLLNKEKVLCRQLYEDPDLLNLIGIHKERHAHILKEVNELCKL